MGCTLARPGSAGSNGSRKTPSPFTSSTSVTQVHHQQLQQQQQLTKSGHNSASSPFQLTRSISSGPAGGGSQSGARNGGAGGEKGGGGGGGGGAASTDAIRRGFLAGTLTPDPRCPLDARQMYGLTKTWKAINRNMSVTAINIFVRLFETNADIKEMFSSIKDLKTVADLRSSKLLEMHAMKVLCTIDDAIVNMDDMDYVLRILELNAESHCCRFPSFNSSYFWRIEEPFILAVKDELGDRFTISVENTYRATIRFILTELSKQLERHQSLAGTPPPVGPVGGCPAAAACPQSSGPPSVAAAASPDGEEVQTAAAASENGKSSSCVGPLWLSANCCGAGPKMAVSTSLGCGGGGTGGGGSNGGCASMHGSPANGSTVQNFNSLASTAVIAAR